MTQTEILEFVTGAEPADWPQLTAGAGPVGTLSLKKASLALDAGREVSFAGDGRIRSPAALRLQAGTGEGLCIQPDGKVGIGVATPGHALDVKGTVNASDFLKDGQPLTTSQWRPVDGGITFMDGKVGIGNVAPRYRLDVVADEGVRLGNLYISSEGRNTNSLSFNAYRSASAGGWVFPDPFSPAVNLKMDNEGLGFGARFEVWTTTNANKTEWTQRLAIDGEKGETEVHGILTVQGDVRFRNSSGGQATLGGYKVARERVNSDTVRLVMDDSWVRGNLGFPGSYEFAIGHFTLNVLHQPDLNPGDDSTSPFVFATRFSVDEAGNMYTAGAKMGYVADYFVNRVGEDLEQGDVVVISEQPVTRYLGANNNIPLPEVDLTGQAYDRRVCGVVAQLVTEAHLPFVEQEPVPAGKLEALRSAAAAAFAGAATRPAKELPPAGRPWRGLVAPAGSDLNRTPVADGQLGQMVTLGAFAHCKVDADIASIRVGDLLTTSPTRGHAQKVEDFEKATGAVLGKALASLEKGKGKIPILLALS